MTDQVQLRQPELNALNEVGVWQIEIQEAIRQIIAARVPEAKADALNEAADAIQALHPGEVKNSVIFLRDRARAVLATRRTDMSSTNQEIENITIPAEPTGEYVVRTRGGVFWTKQHVNNPNTAYGRGWEHVWETQGPLEVFFPARIEQRFVPSGEGS